ncbi:MAG TPA: MFS transporter [Paenibacillus sp.]|jgi:predicted MFS family arabinose efflux permease
MLIRVLHGLGFGIATTLFATFVAHNVPAHRLGEGMGYFAIGETLAISVGPLLGVWLIGQYGFTPLFTTSALLILLSLLLTISMKKTSEEKPKKFEWGFKLYERRVLFPAFLVLLCGLAAGSIMSFAAIFASEMAFDNVAWFFFTIAFFSFIVRIFSGKLYDKKGPAPILLVGIAFSIIG